jgi:hypothetical protein
VPVRTASASGRPVRSQCTSPRVSKGDIRTLLFRGPFLSGSFLFLLFSGSPKAETTEQEDQEGTRQNRDVPQFLLSYFLLSWIDLSDTTEKEEQGQKGLSKSRGRPDKK